jgi:uncharacterized membrane protein YqjE
MPVPDQGSRLGDSLRRVLGTTLELGQARLRLLATEFELEKLRIFDALLWAVIGLLFVTVSVVLLAVLLLMMLQEVHRLPALAVMVLVALAAGAWMIGRARRLLQGEAPLFEATVAELDRDRAALLPRE